MKNKTYPKRNTKRARDLAYKAMELISMSGEPEKVKKADLLMDILITFSWKALSSEIILEWAAMGQDIEWSEEYEESLS